ncbi:hypothetical protein [Desulfogranum japonicum]|uniref:hypothetical protein n=1 Tax=Desulfogranum japonicum TaxID=231447 RepID=UPI0004274F5E|nr:hypothetical protein [Desulfogranum japonicum]
MRIFIIITVFLIIFGANFCLGSSETEFGVSYDGPGYQYDFIDILVKEQIPFYLDDEGVVKIDKKYNFVVKKIMEKVETRPYVVVSGEKYASTMALLLSKNKVDYDVRVDCLTGNIYFIWSSSDNEIARRVSTVDFAESIKTSYKTRRLGDYLID